MIFRALQFAYSDPKGPVYLMGAARGDGGGGRARRDRPGGMAPDLAGGAVPRDDVGALCTALVAAKRPLVVTSFAGPQPGRRRASW